MSNVVSDWKYEFLWEQAYELYYDEGFRGEQLDELCSEYVKNALENGDE